MRRTLLVAVMIALSTHLLSAQCAILFKYGMYDFHSSAGIHEQASSFVNWVCSQHANNSGESGDIEVPIGDTPVKLGGNGSSSDSESSCASQAGQNQIKHAFLTQSATINTEALKAYQNCISAFGLSDWLETTADPHVVRLVVNVKPIKDGQTAIVKSFTQKGASCIPPLKRGDPIGIAGFSSLCTRKLTSSEITVNLNTDMAPQNRGQLSIAGLKVVSQPCCEKSWSEYIEDGNPVYFVTLPTINQPKTCLGSILPSSVYTIAYEKVKDGWYGAGPHGDGNCPSRTRDYWSIDNYNCLNFPQLCGILKKNEWWFDLWGANFTVDNEGKVYQVDTHLFVGNLLRDRQAAY